MRRQAFTIVELIMVVAIVALLSALAVAYLKMTARTHYSGSHSTAQNCRQIALAGIMYGGDYDDMMPITTNGWLCRMQDIKDGALTVNCPASGTQDSTVADAAGGERTDAWPLLLIPYIRSRGLFINPDRSDTLHIWSAPAHAVADVGYDPSGATYRNQNRFPMYGYNYMFCSPLRIPVSKRGLANASNYAVSEGHAFTDADDPSGTIYFVDSQSSLTDSSRGFYVVNAPGMWDAFKNNNHGLVGFWTGGAGSGDWVGTKTACADASTPCKNPGQSTGFVSMFYNGGANTTFLDGHVKYTKAAAFAAGTDYLTATANADGSGAHIVDKKAYLWNLTKDFHGL